MLKCLIIDDEQFSIDAILKYFAMLPRLELVSVFQDPVEAMNKIVAMPDAVDIIFMDIDMPSLSGIELAAIVRSKTQKLIFTTSYSQYAYEAYEVNGDAFLLKPFSFSKFSATINRLFPPEAAMAPAKRFDEDYFLVKNKDENLRMVNIAFNDVIAFESFNNYIKIYLVGEKVITAYLTLKDINDIVAMRTEFQQFHRAFVISTRHISYIEGNQIKMTNMLQFNVGDRYKEIFNNYIADQLLKTGRKTKGDQPG